MDRIAALKARARLRSRLRHYLDRAGWLEVETPVRIAAPAPEEFIETIPADGKFLRPSPELEMKVLLAEGFRRIYQLGPCFRAGEHGRRHREEFTMLEYYAVDMDYLELAHFTARLLRECLGDALSYRRRPIDLAGPAEFLTVAEAFRRYAPGGVEEAEASDRFDEWMVVHIEPNLGTVRPTFLIEYPAARASLARLKPGDPSVAERWELYIAGIELANAYGELRDPAEQRRRFEKAAAHRAAAGMHSYPAPERFYAALEQGLPPVSGSALGFDRLAMLAVDADDIAQVLAE